MLRTACVLPILALTLVGCLTPKSVEPTRFYTVTPEDTAPGEAVSDASLGIRPLIAARPYKLEVAYRAETNRLAYYPRSEWAELPGTLVSRALMDALSRSRLFADTGDAAIMARPDYIFTGELRRFEADLSGDVPEFVATVSASIRSSDGGAALWRNEVNVRVPLQEAPPNAGADAVLADVARAASEAVTQLGTEICVQVRASLAESKAN